MRGQSEVIDVEPRLTLPSDVPVIHGGRPGFLPRLVVKNAFALYGVQVGRKLIPLASIPYLARVLGPAGWGEVAFITALAELVVILIEFGFNLSATRAISRFRENPAKRGEIVVGVLSAQGCLAVFGILGAIIAAQQIPSLRNHWTLLAAGLVYAVAQGLVPIWYFQGTERIRLAAVTELTAKAIALGALFLLVKSPADTWRALAIQAFSPAASTVVGIVLVIRTSVLCRPNWRLVREVLREGWNMFIFRSAESLYGVANAFLLGLFVPPILVGYFASAEKVSKATAGLLNPIRESLYPRINSLIQRDFEEARRLAQVGAGLMVVGGTILSAVLFFAAQPLVSALLGGRFEPAVQVLRILSPLPFLLGITFSCGQLWLLPMSKDGRVTQVVICAAVLNVGLSLFVGKRWGHVGMAWTVLISEAVVSQSLLWTVVTMAKAGKKECQP